MAPQDPTAPTDSNGDGLLVTAIVALIISWLSVAMRVYVRAIMMNSFKVDDWVMLAGLANFTVSCSFIFVGLPYGIGRHNRSLSQPDEIEALKYQALATASYISNMWLIKLSIGLFLLRLAVQKRYKYILGISIVVVGVWSLVLFFWNLFQCSPVSAQWDYTILASNPKSHCVSADEVVSAAYALSALTILSDWLYALIPIPLIWQVKMTPQAKLTVIAVLGLGIFASIATLIRLKFLADLTDAADILHAGTDAMIWTLIEPGIAISAASLATIRPLLRRWKIKGFTNSERSRGTGLTNQDHGSRVRRANRMPGFGSQDLTLVDVELGPRGSGKSVPPAMGAPATKFAQQKISYMPKVFEVSQDEHETGDELLTFRQGGTRRIEIRSEALIIEGAQSPSTVPNAYTNGTWLDQESDGSSVELSRPGLARLATPSRPTPQS
ncbi:hypothetical protein F5Y19DRAFT_272758 [Xylariaceae sp. FL1651]|nr:hypothetical protein F5Y19DRAFT_272758 [Xylariaceae sp. FL1651]